MAKITLDPMVGSYASVTALNSRFQQIENALNDDVLWRNNPVGETNTMMNDLDMNGYSLLNAGIFTSDDKYLGTSATPPTTATNGETLSTTHTGYLYFNSSDNSMYVWTGTAWSSLTSAATSASAVSIADSGGLYVATNVEDALQEIRNDMASTATGKGASDVGIEDSAGYFTATTVEGALAELGAAPGGSGSSVDKNILHNGSMKVSQKTETSFDNLSSLSATTKGWVSYADRWMHFNSCAGSTWKIVSSNTNAGDPSFATIGDYSPHVTTFHLLGAGTMGANEWSAIFQNLDVDQVNRIMAENNVRLSFWVSSGITGTFSVTLSLQTGVASQYAMTKTFTISTADTWEKKELTFPISTRADAGSFCKEAQGDLKWENRLSFNLGTGTTYAASAADTWAAGRKYGLTTDTDFTVSGTATDEFSLAFVQLEAGSTTTAFEAEDHNKELAEILPILQCHDPKTRAYGWATSTTAGFGDVEPFVPMIGTIATADHEVYASGYHNQYGASYAAFSGTTITPRHGGGYTVNGTGGTGLTAGRTMYIDNVRALIYTEYPYI